MDGTAVWPVAGRCPDHSAHERAIAVHDKRLDAHGDAIDDLRTAIVKLTDIERQNQTRIDAMEDALREAKESMDERISQLEARPGRRWDTAVTVVVTASLTTAVNLLTAQALPGIGG